ncbi:unnamed protein product [Adineta steineri]|uniref:Uncharacterized protein n=2 Tax=Adineta steineri TaxID=433720 RepID=A0A813R2D6_9BILA|nr:unnamed protein product [Adineta steineri]CAF4177858.1 unnamed protein product [Adineta steineri]
MFVNDVSCNVQARRDFYYGLKHYPRYQEYEEVYTDTIFALQNISSIHGKCINDNKQHNPPCYYALQETIKNCIKRLSGVPEKDARHYCGYTLMKYCAVYGLRRFPRRNDYVNVCYDTVNSLQNIPQKYGKCFNEATNKINPACIYALATTMRNCVSGLDDVPEFRARYYCGYKLMQNCAKNVGLERFPYNSQYQKLDDGDDEN